MNGSGRAVATCLLIGSLLAASCGPTNDVEIVVDGSTRWARNVGLDSYAWDDPIDNLSPVPTLTLEAHTVGVNFRDIEEQTAVTFPKNPACTPLPGTVCPPFVIRRRPELHLFERDPRQMYFALTTDPFDNPWVSNLSSPTIAGINTPPFELPADVVIPYYDIGQPWLDFYPTHVSVPTFTEQDFLMPQGGGTTTLSQWDRPSSGGVPITLRSTSIAAARLLTLPECSTSIDVQNIVFSAVKGVVGGALQCEHVSDFAPVPVLPPLGVVGEVFPTLVSLTATTYLSHQDPALDNYPGDLGPASVSNPLAFQGVLGGVLLSGDVHATMQVDYNTLGLDLNTPCDVSFIYDYRYGIDPGTHTFALTPLQVQLTATPGSLCNGGFGGLVKGLKDTIQTLLEQQIPNFAQGFATSKQVLPQAPIDDFRFRCDLLSGDDIATKCSMAIETLRLGVDAGAGNLGISDTTGLDATVQDPSHWRCRPDTPEEITWDCAPTGVNSPAPSYTSGRCDFSLPAADVIAEPDEIRVTWPTLEDFASSNPSPSTVAFVASFSSSNTAYQQLCSPPVDVTSARPLYERYFATLNVSNQACKEPGPPGPPLVCGCSQDINCIDRFGNGARCVSGFCQPPSP